ncbi:hypothetical protein GGF32_007382 [Allomyces javanicus]|nr:hypothetical protein GGF32_007382 [Allomyces javanicus]
MSAAAVASTAPVDTLPTVTDASSTAVGAPVYLKDEALAAHAAVLRASKNGDEVDKDVLGKLVNAIGAETADTVSRDALLAHTLLLSLFHHELRDGDNEAKDLAFLCSSEARYLAYLDAVAKAAISDRSFVDTLPLPPMDVAMLMHSHMLSPLRFADDMTRCYGRTFVGLSLPLMPNKANLVRSGSSGVYHFHTEALVQYPKFLALAVAHPDKGLAPTSAIDLAWHTHQLSPLMYGKQTLALMGQIMNHDDSDDAESEARIADSAKAA